MPLDPGGALCACGRRGCWETSRLLLSTLGFTAPARGGALLAPDPVYEDPAHTVATATGA